MNRNLTDTTENSESGSLLSGLPFWRTLRWSLIASYLLLAVGPVLVVIAGALLPATTRTEQQIFNQLESVADLKQDQINRWIGDAQTALELFMADPLRQNQIVIFIASYTPDTADLLLTEQAYINHLLGNSAEINPVFSELFIYNMNGTVIAASAPDQINQTVDDQPYFATSLDGVNIHPPYEIAPGELAMFVTQPLYSREGGRTIAVLAGRLNLAVLRGLMTSETGLGSSGQTYLVSARNNYLLTPIQAEVKTYTIVHSQGIDRALQGQDGQGRYENHLVPAERVIGVYRWLPDLQLALMSEIDEAAALAQLRRGRSVTMMIGLGAALVAVLVGLFMAGRLTGPIVQLTGTATRIAEGDLSRRVKASGPPEIRLLATVFNRMTGQLQELVDTLEDQVTARTERLEAVATLGEQIGGILDFDQLLSELVNQVKQRFDYYHVHIYMLDKAGQNLVITAGVGEAGAKMKAEGHAIALDTATSLVARAARSGEIVWVDNVRQAEDWLPNPLLPDTYSEMAIPIKVEAEVVGVLDVQDDEIGGLDEADANLLRYVANRVAVAINNARLFEQVERALNEARAAQERYLEQAWDRSRIKIFGGKYLYTAPDASPPDEKRQQLIDQLRQESEENKQARLEDMAEAGQALVVPVWLHEKMIGALQLHTSRPGQTWSEEDLAIIETVMNQFSQIAENLRLFDESREQAGREQIIRQITDKLRAAPNLDRLLEIAARELGQRLQVRHTVLELGINGQAEPTEEETQDTR